MEKKEVFISYKSEDYESASWVRGVLETNGVSCWMAPDCIPGGSSYAKEIPYAIKNCKVFVVIVSEVAQESMWVPRELDQAINAKKPIMPFMLENCNLKDDFNFYLSNVQRYAAYEDKAKTMQKMIARIKSVIETENRLEAQSEEAQEEESPAPKAAAASSPARVSKPKKDKKPFFKNKKVLIGGAVGVLAIAIGVLLILLLSGKNTIDLQNTYRILISRTVKTDVEDFRVAQEALSNRLSLLDEASTCTLKEDNTIEAFVSKSVLQGEDPEEAMERYVTTTGEIALVQTQEDSFYYSYLPIDRRDVKKVELLSGTPDFAFSKKPETGGEFSYIHIALSESFLEKNQEDLEGFTAPELCFKNEDWNIGSTFGVYYDGKGNIYLADPFANGAFTKVVYEILNQEVLTTCLEAIIDIESLMTWEDTATAEKPGKNQCACSETGERSVLFTYTLYDSDISDRTKGQEYDFLAVLKARLDLLEQPYAVGTQYKNEKLFKVAVKTACDKINDDVVKLLADDGTIVLRAGKQETSCYGTTYTIKDNALAVQADNSLFDAFVQKHQAQADNIYLSIKGKEILYAPAKGADGTLVFSHINYEKDGEGIPLTEQTVWLAKLCSKIAQETVNMLYIEAYSPIQVAYEAEDNIGSDDLFFGAYQKNAQAYETLLQEVSDKVRVSIDDKQLNVFLHLSVNTAFAEQAPLAAKRVYELIDFENAPFETVGVYMVDEDEDETERARIFFQKEYEDIFDENDLDTDGIIYVNGIFLGGKIDLVKDALMKNIQNDAFYQKLNVSGKTFWDN